MNSVDLFLCLHGHLFASSSQDPIRILSADVGASFSQDHSETIEDKVRSVVALVEVDNAIGNVVDNDVAGDVTSPSSLGSYDHDNSLHNRLYHDQHCDVHHFGSLKRHPYFLLISVETRCFPTLKCII